MRRGAWRKNVPRAERGYFKEQPEPRIDIQIIGEVNDRIKEAFLANGAALLFPIDWPEPFGLVMIAAMACGTPVIAFRRGSVPEVIEDGMTGFIVDGEEQACPSCLEVRGAARAGPMITNDGGGLRAAPMTKMQPSGPRQTVRTATMR
jgi:glycosyltransferase involved in cell wall biosynthesis